MNNTVGRPLRKATTSAYVYGICAGLAYTLGLSVHFVRVLMLIFGIITFPVVFLIYFGLHYTLISWGTEPDDFEETIH